MYANQFAYDNAEPEGVPEIPDFVYDEARKKFSEDWLCYTELPEKAMSVLTKLAQKEKPNDLELFEFRKELGHAYDIAEEHFIDDYLTKWLKE